MDKAYRKLNKSSGTGHGSMSSASHEGEEAGRVEKDDLDEDDEAAVESSEEEYESSSDELSDADPAAERVRGRRKKRTGSDAEGGEPGDEGQKAQSQMAAAEEESKFSRQVS